MQIQRITSSTNFGYNKALNERVNKKLDKENSEYSNILMTLNQVTNLAEDMARYAEQKGDKLKCIDYSYMVIKLKPFVAEMIDEKYPKMKYSVNELKDYNKEIRSRGLEASDHWLKDVTFDLAEYVSTSSFVNGTQDIDAMKKAIEESPGPSTLAAPSQTVTVDPEAAKLLDKFVPNEFSPAGLDSLGGMSELKESLIDKIIFPATHPEEAKMDEIEYGKKAPRGIMLYGPPGCGKTSVIEAMASETGFPLYKLKVGKAGSKYVNQTSSNVQKAYEYAVSVAKQNNTPVFLAIDEMESLTSRRRGAGSGEDDKVVSTLLQIIEEARGNNVIVIGATNCFDQIDDAIKSRFDDKLYIGLPDDDTRSEVLKIHLSKRTKGLELANNPEELQKVVKMTKGFSNRDIAILTDKAALIARKDGRRDIEARDFEVPVRENQNMKVKESLYQDKSKQAKIGFA